MDSLTTNMAAERLGVSRRRVIALIESGRLVAEKFGRDYIIKESDLTAVAERKPGRPKKEPAALNEEERQFVEVMATAIKETAKEKPAKPKSAKSLTDGEKKRIRDEQQARWRASVPGKQATKKEGAAAVANGVTSAKTATVSKPSKKAAPKAKR